MLRSAWSELRAHPGRFAAVCLAIVLGTGFAAGTLIFTAGVHQALGRSVGAQYSRIDLVVTTDRDTLDLADLATVHGVRNVQPAVNAYLDYTGPDSRGYLKLTNLPTDPDQRWYTLAAGHWATTATELMVDQGTAQRNHWTVGSAVTLGSAPDERTAVISGIVDNRLSPLAAGDNTAYAPYSLVSAFAGTDVGTAYALVESGAPVADVAATISRLVPGATARTREQMTEQAIQSLSGGTDVITVILLAFVVLAALVAAMVVANTFTILITQRQRQIALLRCIGATGTQVRRSALAEAGLVAIIGSVLGVGTGIVVGRVAGAIAGISGVDFTVRLGPMLLVGLLGVVVTVVAALAPTARAMRIPPIAALRPVDSTERQRAVGRLRLVAGSLLLLGGGAVLAYGVFGQSLMVAMGGGAGTAIGVLVLLRVVLPTVVRLVSGVGGLFGAPGRLAVANTLRNPTRAAATCTALVVGVGAIVTLLVAASSAQAGADQAVGARNPLDLQVTATTGTLPDQLRGALGAVDGIRTAVAIRGTTVTLDGSDYQAFGPTAEQLTSVRNGGELPAGQVALPEYLVTSLGLHSGDPVTVSRGPVSVTLAVATRPVTDDGSIVLLASDLARLDPAAPVLAVWAKFTADAAPNDILAAVNPLVAPYDGVFVSGSGVQRAATADTLSGVIKVALALLAVAVVIAVVGIGNTLGLSVVERIRESALLRALGLRRRQLRSMLAVEAALLALVAGLVGTVFGLLFGWAGAGAAFGESGDPVVLTAPWLGLGLVIVGAVLAGVLASVLPGRRAARATPTQALADA